MDKFIYNFQDVTLDRQIYEDPLVEMVRQQIKILLDTVVFIHEGREVKIDGFKLHFDEEKTYSLYKVPDKEPEENA